MTDYILEISFDSRDAALDEVVQSRLFVSPCTGSTSSEIGGTTTIAAYFDSAADRDAAVESLRDVDGIALHAVDRRRVDWLDRYQQSLQALIVGRRFVIAPDASLLPARGDRLTIVVPQEQAFGTGSHETTALCMELLEALDLRDRRGLDVGSGSGILALAMHRLGAAKAIAFDNDTDAYGALRDNRMRNNVPDGAMPLFIGSVESLRDGTFDAITMNIIPEVILPLLGQVARRLASDGKLILSGILIVKADEVIRAAATHGLRLVDGRERGEWWAGVFV